MFPLINTGKSPREQYLADSLILRLPANTPYGNLCLKWTQIILRMDYVNLCIEDIYATYKKPSEELFGFSHSKRTLRMEEVIYWLRKTADELIALTHILAMREQIGSYPEKVNPDSIGRLASASCTLPFIKEHTRYLEKLNQISNAYKHSFVNFEVNLVGRDEPCVFALALKQNQLKYDMEFHAVSFRDVIERFDCFFQSSYLELKNCKLPH